MSYLQRLQNLSIELPSVAPTPPYLSLGVVRGGFLYLSGQTPRVAKQMAIAGKVGADVDVAEAFRAAGICAIRLIAAAQSVLGSLDCIESVVELTIYVHATPDFQDPSLVANAASKVFLDVFGEAGEHARTAVCVTQLPSNAAVEVSAVLAVLAVAPARPA